MEYVGLVNFVDNTVNYFLLFATMGMSILGIREKMCIRDSYESSHMSLFTLCRLKSELEKDVYKRQRICLFRDTFQIVGCACGYFSQD